MKNSLKIMTVIAIHFASSSLDTNGRAEQTFTYNDGTTQTGASSQDIRLTAPFKLSKDL